MKTAWQSLSDFPPNCHKSLTDFFLHSFFFWLRLIKWSSCLFFPLPPEAENAHFGETYSSFASLPLLHASVDGQPLRGLSQPRHSCPSRALPLLQSAQQQGASSWAAKPSLDTRAGTWALQMDLIPADWQLSSCMEPCCLLSLLPLEV